jgi:hypothetical protein
VLTGLHRPDAAIDAWREIVKIAPDDPQALKGLITLLMQQKRYGEAVPYLESAAKNDTSSAIQNTLGTAYLHLGQVEKGTAILEKSCKPIRRLCWRTTSPTNLLTVMLICRKRWSMRNVRSNRRRWIRMLSIFPIFSPTT